ncbi:hypothetical protein BJ944DRAFT_286545 [Cunninghamella echinulata]|nr:hypothetical protein BJ944DRAFT_286545 [Cunninghamella echinulata]
MKQCFPSRSQAIQLSSDDEDEYGTSSSLPYNCINNCLPQFNMGFIKLPTEDATLDDYLNPNTTTTIEPLLEEYNNSDDDNNSQFGNATLKEPKKFLSRNPFASSSSTPALTSNKNNTQFDHHNDNITTNNNHNDQINNTASYNNNDGYLPRLDFFMDQDDDAEFLSDHRISAVIGDTSKLTNQFKLFEAEEINKGIQDRELSSLEQNDHCRRSLESISSFSQPFEIDNQSPKYMNRPLKNKDDDNDVNDEELLLDAQYDVATLQTEHSIEVIEESEEEQNILETDSSSPKEQHLDQHLDHITTATSPAGIVIDDNDNGNEDENIIGDEMIYPTNSAVFETELMISPIDIEQHLNHNQKQQEVNNTDILSYTINDSDERIDDHYNDGTKDIKELNAINTKDDNNNIAIDANHGNKIDANDNKKEEKEQKNEEGNDEKNQVTEQLKGRDNEIESSDHMDNSTAITAISEHSNTPVSTPSTSSSTNAITSFPSTGLTRTPYKPSNQQSSIIYPPMDSPSTTNTATNIPSINDNKNSVTSYQQALDTKEPSSKLNINNQQQQQHQQSKNTHDGNINTKNNNDNSSDDALKLFNGNGIRRSSVASMAQSLLGDKLEDFTEKLAYIKKNIIMSLDDTDDDGDDNNDHLQRQQQQRRRRQRSGSTSDTRKQTFDPFVSRFSGKQQTNNVETAPSHPNHRRSNSLMDVAPSLAKLVNQIGGGNNNNNNVDHLNNEQQQQYHFSPSSFFSSMAGPEPTLQKKVSSNQLSNSNSVLPERSSSMQFQPQPQQMAPTSLTRSRSSNLSSSPSSSSLYSNKSRSATSLQHINEPINEEEEERNDDDDEDLFDFSKMIALSKNAKNFSEDVIGNGIRLFNDFSTRMKNANKLHQQQLHQAQLAQQQHSLQASSSPASLPPQQQQQLNDNESSMDQEFLLGDTFI